MRPGAISGNRMWGWLALAVVVAVIVVIGAPTLMTAVKVRNGNPVSADLQTTARTNAKAQNQPGADQPQ